MGAVYLSRKNHKGKWEAQRYESFDGLAKELDILLRFGVNDFMISAKRNDRESFEKIGKYFKERRRAFQVQPNGSLLANMSMDGGAGGTAGFLSSAVGSIAVKGGAAGVYNFLAVAIQSGLVTACKTATVTPDPTAVCVGAGVGLVIGLAHGYYRTTSVCRISISAVDPGSIDFEFFEKAA